MVKRIFLLVLDSFGIGDAPDAAAFFDEGSNTLGAVAGSVFFSMPEVRQMGLMNIDGVTAGAPVSMPRGCFGRLQERSSGKDTTIGHWEIAGVVSETPLPTYPNGFPPELLERFSAAVGRGVLCNKPYSGTDVIRDYGDEHVETGKLIVYTSADSVFQIAAHEGLVPLDTLYGYCKTARELLSGEHGVGRVIARPFVGESGNYQRTRNRHDYSLLPPKKTMLDFLTGAGKQVLAVGKIGDIFAMQGVTRSIPTQSNREGMQVTLQLLNEDFCGLCFVNLVDFDMVYGHRNDVDGYARSLSEFDAQLGAVLAGMRKDDLLILTADHGCDPFTESTDHSRECVPLLIAGDMVNPNRNLHTRETFADIAATVLDLLGVPGETDGVSLAKEVLR